MTYSIVARDEMTGEIGVAVQTCMFAVGSVVPWARPGVGAVATQASGERAYGPRCLDALARGSTAAEALAEAQAADPMAAFSQVGVVSADGTVATATGEHCIDHAGDLVGGGLAVQANMMSTPDVWPAMAADFESSSGPLARRLLTALVAGEAAGGDARGRMSAALLVVEGTPAKDPGGGVLVNLRVDRSEDPLAELGELLTAAEGFSGFFGAFAQLLDGDPVTALGTIERALGTLPHEGNLRFLRALALIASGAVDEGASELRALIAERATWQVVIRGFATQHLIAMPDGVSIDALLG